MINASNRKIDLFSFAGTKLHLHIEHSIERI